jgi:hypothetical protein
VGFSRRGAGSPEKPKSDTSAIPREKKMPRRRETATKMTVENWPGAEGRDSIMAYLDESIKQLFAEAEQAKAFEQSKEADKLSGLNAAVEGGFLARSTLGWTFAREMGKNLEYITLGARTRNSNSGSAGPTSGTRSSAAAARTRRSSDTSTCRTASTARQRGSSEWRAARMTRTRLPTPSVSSTRASS